MTKALEQISAHELVELQTSQFELIKNGHLTFKQLIWFHSLSFEEREDLLFIKEVDSGEMFGAEAALKETDNSIDFKIESIGEDDGPAIMSKSVLGLISGTAKLLIKDFDYSDVRNSRYDIFGSDMFDSCKHLKSNITKSQPMKNTPVCVYALKKDADFSTIFHSVQVALDRLCFTREQIRNFCLFHYTWLAEDGPTYFLFKDIDDYFVARVLIPKDSKMRIIEEPLSCGHVWQKSEQRRVVLPNFDSIKYYEMLPRG